MRVFRSDLRTGVEAAASKLMKSVQSSEEIQRMPNRAAVGRYYRKIPVPVAGLAGSVLTLLTSMPGHAHIDRSVYESAVRLPGMSQVLRAQLHRKSQMRRQVSCDCLRSAQRE